MWTYLQVQFYVVCFLFVVWWIQSFMDLSLWSCCSQKCIFPLYTETVEIHEKFKISALSYYRTQNRIFHFYVAYQWCCTFRLCISQKLLALIYDHRWEGWRVNKQFPKFWKHWSLNVSRCYWLIWCNNNNVTTCHMTWSLLIHEGQRGRGWCT